MFIFAFVEAKLASLTYIRRGARAVEEARLESVYTPKGYRGFESHSLRPKCFRTKLFIQNNIKNLIDYAKSMGITACHGFGSTIG